MGNSKSLVWAIVFIILSVFVLIIISLLTDKELNYTQNTVRELRSEVSKLKDRVENLEEHKTRREYLLTVTAYTASEDETDSTPNTTAIMEEPKSGRTVAVSQDLKRFLGAKVYIEGIGIRVVNDLMNERYRRSIDVFVGAKEQATEIGRSVKSVVFYKLDR